MSITMRSSHFLRATSNGAALPTTSFSEEPSDPAIHSPHFLRAAASTSARDKLGPLCAGDLE